jgi:hypothetical protein
VLSVEPLSPARGQHEAANCARYSVPNCEACGGYAVDWNIAAVAPFVALVEGNYHEGQEDVEAACYYGGDEDGLQDGGG